MYSYAKCIENRYPLYLAINLRLTSQDKWAPFGILNMMTGLLTILFGTSFETSDFIVDCLDQWWNDNKEQYRHIRQLVINLDNGPQNSSHRTQFMKRMIDFADKNNLEIVLAYYPAWIFQISFRRLARCDAIVWCSIETGCQV